MDPSCHRLLGQVPVAFALTKNEGLQVANHIDFLFSCFGPPAIPQGDNGTEFIAVKWWLFGPKSGVSG